MESDQLPAAPEPTDLSTVLRSKPAREGLADADHAGGDQRLVDHFGVLPAAGAALMGDRFAEQLKARQDALQSLGLAADHDR